MYGYKWTNKNAWPGSDRPIGIAYMHVYLAYISQPYVCMCIIPNSCAVREKDMCTQTPHSQRGKEKGRTVEKFPMPCVYIKALFINMQQPMWQDAQPS